MRKLKYNLTKIVLNQIYISYVLPTLEYLSLVWDGCTQHDTNTLEKLQHEAARIVTGHTISFPGKLIQKMRLDFTFRNAKQQKIIFMYISINSLVPTYIAKLLPPLTGNVINYDPRNRNNITIPFFKNRDFA